MEHIKPSNMSIFCAILYSPTHLLTTVYWQAHMDANYCNIHTTAIGQVPKAQNSLIRMNYSNRNYKAIHCRGHVVKATIRNSDNIENQWKKIIQHNSNDTATVSMETHINELEISKCKFYVQYSVHHGSIYQEITNSYFLIK
jgi:hypothetical protein